MDADRHAVTWPWLAASIALVAALVWSNMAILGDGFWTLATGRWILAHRALPTSDPFAYASAPGRWIVHMPLCQIVFAWINEHAGLVAVMIAGALIEIAAVLVLWLGQSRTLAARVATFPLALWYLYLGAGDLSVRGQLFGDLCFAVLLWCLFRIARGLRVHPALAIALGAVWANTHPSFLLTIVLPVAYAAFTRLDPLDERPAIRPLLAFAALATAGTLLNPYGPLMHLDVVRLLFDRTTAHIDLFRSPDFHSPLWLATIASGLGLCWLRLATGSSSRQRSDVALLLAFVAATCWARRYGTLLIGVELAVAGTALSHQAPARMRRLVTAPALIALAVIELVATLRIEAAKVDPLRDVPADATAFIRDHRLPGNVMNPYHWGGYLEYAWDGNRKAFIDGRNQLFSNGSYDDSRVLRHLTTGWRAVLDVYEVRTVLWERGAPLDLALAREPAWWLVHRGRLADVYVRRSRR